MESRVGRDFSGERVHTDRRAAGAPEAVGTAPFADGRDVVFRTDQREPQTGTGRSPLTHVVVERSAATGTAFPGSLSHLLAGSPTSTAASVLYRQPVGTPTAPKFSIVGTPDITATPDGQEVNSYGRVATFLGAFVMDARVQVDAPDIAAFSDWELGVVQMMSGGVDANCYRRPAARGKARDAEIFVERMHPPTQMFHPDRDPASPVFVDQLRRIDLGASHGGRKSFQVKLHAEDHPGYDASAFASAHTGRMTDTDVEIFRHRHRGFFYTYVVARQKSTGRLIPLHTAYWWLGADFGYIHPARELGFQATEKNSLTFRLIKSHAFSAGDFFPVVAGDTVQQLSTRRLQERRLGECPGFVELGGGQ